MDEYFKPTFSELDRFHQPGKIVKRKFKSLSHARHSFMALLGELPSLLEVYLFKALDPRFRERIMIATAVANDCYT